MTLYPWLAYRLVVWLSGCLVTLAVCLQHLSVSEKLQRNLMERSTKYSLSALRIQCAYRAYRTRTHLRALIIAGTESLKRVRESLCEDSDGEDDDFSEPLQRQGLTDSSGSSPTLRKLMSVQH